MWMRWVGLLCALAMAVGWAEARAEKEAEGDDASGFKVCIQPLGKYDNKLAKVAARGARYLYGVEVEILERDKLPKSAWYKPRKRWRADKLLDHLEGQVPDGCNLVIGFTREDISTTKGKIKDWGIFGLASIGGPTGMVSTHRLGRHHASFENKARRTINVFNHELGHALGVPHVPKKGCLMQDAAGTIKSVDGESGLLCKGSIEIIERKNKITLPVLTSFDWNEVL